MLSHFSCVPVDPMVCSPPGSSVHGILQARILEWVATPSSRGPSPPRDQACIAACTGRQVLCHQCHLPGITDVWGQVILGHGGCPVHWWPLSSAPGLCPLDARNISTTQLQPKLSPDVAKCLLAVKVKVAQSCPALSDPRDYTVHGILQAGILQWVAFPFSRGSSQPRNWTRASCIAGFFTNWAIREVSRQEVGQIHNQLKTSGLQSERLGFKVHLFHLLICKIRIHILHTHQPSLMLQFLFIDHGLADKSTPWVLALTLLNKEKAIFPMRYYFPSLLMRNDVSLTRWAQDLSCILLTWDYK